MNGQNTTTPAFSKARGAAIIVGAIGFALCVAGFFVNRGQLFQSWLFAHQFWLGLGLGGLGVLMTHHLMGGRWGVAVERILEAMALTLPLLALLFVPIFFGMRELYPWMHPDPGEAEHLRAKAAYLNFPFFIVRAAVYFAVWIVLARVYRRWSLAQDRDPSAERAGRMLRTGAFGIVLYFFTMTFAAIDWTMSLEPQWYSTVYGAVVIIGQAMQALAFAAIVLAALAGRAELRPFLAKKPLNDLGNMLMAFIMIWTYMAFMQYLVIWMADLSEEIPWVLHRSRGGWQWVSSALIAFGFFLPFTILLFRAVKQRTARLAQVAVIVVVMRLVATQWLIAPEFHARISVHWLDLAALAAVGGFWVAAFLSALARAPLAPLHDPRAHPEAILEEISEGRRI